MKTSANEGFIISIPYNITKSIMKPGGNGRGKARAWKRFTVAVKNIWHRTRRTGIRELIGISGPLNPHAVAPHPPGIETLRDYSAMRLLLETFGYPHYANRPKATRLGHMHLISFLV